MYKKEYIAPDCQVIKIDTHTALLAGSLQLTREDDELLEGYGD